MAIKEGTVTVSSAGTAVQFEATGISVRSIYILAPDTNTGLIYLGSSTVSSSLGPRMAPGKELTLSVAPGELPINLSQLYVDAASSSDKIEYLAITMD